MNCDQRINILCKIKSLAIKLESVIIHNIRKHISKKSFQSLISETHLFLENIFIYLKRKEIA